MDDTFQAQMTLIRHQLPPESFDPADALSQTDPQSIILQRSVSATASTITTLSNTAIFYSHSLSLHQFLFRSHYAHHRYQTMPHIRAPYPN